MTEHTPIPHLNIALTGPLHTIEEHILRNEGRIEDWFQRKWPEGPTLVHSSVDIRNAGFKVAPVDTNLFPAGFNNLNPDFCKLSTNACQHAIHSLGSNIKRILIIPESHTRNAFYLESLATLHSIIEAAGFEVRIGSLLTELTAPQSFNLANGRSLTWHPVQRRNDKIFADEFKPDLVWLNNDLSAGTPDLLQHIAQPITPPIQLGWQQRSKAIHFQYYQQLSHELASLIDLDPWLIDPYFELCGNIDFMSHSGKECLMKYTSILLNRIQKKYDQYHIKQAPYIIIKADAGTYGMAVMRIHSVEEIQHMNRKQRTRMATSKGRQIVTRILLQEGIPTVETWQQASAEPVVYLMGHHIIGGFYRLHQQRSATESLNAPGMQFEPLAFTNTELHADKNPTVDTAPNRFYTYGVIARLAMLAGSQELKSVLQSDKTSLKTHGDPS